MNLLNQKANPLVNLFSVHSKLMSINFKLYFKGQSLHLKYLNKFISGRVKRYFSSTFRILRAALEALGSSLNNSSKMTESQYLSLQ